MKLENDEADINPYTAPDSDFIFEETPEGFRFGKFWQRAIAGLIDILFSYIFVLFGYIVIFFISLSLPLFPAYILMIFSPLILFWVYFSVFEFSGLQATLGKKCLGLKVTDLQGNRISLGRSTLRFFCKILSLLLLGLGFWIQPFTEKRQALHDLLAGTFVILTE